jgi:hypothetical protein
VVGGYDPELPTAAGISSPSQPAVTGYDRFNRSGRIPRDSSNQQT